MGGREELEEIWAEIHDFTESQNSRSSADQIDDLFR
jgi:hypothetical protein